MRILSPGPHLSSSPPGEVHSDLWEGKFTPDRYGEKLLESRLNANLFGTSVGFADTGFRLHKADSVARITGCSRRRLFVVDVECSTKGPSIGAVERSLRNVRDRMDAETAASALGQKF